MVVTGTDRAPRSAVSTRNSLVVICGVTFLHYAGVFMRVPVLPLYASGNGATPAEVGLIVGAQMVFSALTAIPFGYAADRWGRHLLVVAGMVVSAATSFLVPLVVAPHALMVVYGIAGLGPAAFTPSVMSLVGDLAAPGAIARAYAWYTTALYAGFGLGPMLGGFLAQIYGERAAFVVAGAIILLGLALTARLPRTPVRPPRDRPPGAFADLRGNRRIWGGWVATVSGLAPWGAVTAFFPLLARERGIGLSEIGLFFGVQALVSTASRIPAGWLLDRTRTRRPYVVSGLLLAALGTALIPHVHAVSSLLLLAAGLGMAIGLPFVAIAAALAEATTPATRALAMGGYSTAIFASFAVASFGIAPVVTRWGLATGFTVVAVAGAVGTLAAGFLWGSSAPRRRS